MPCASRIIRFAPAGLSAFKTFNRFAPFKSFKTSEETCSNRSSRSNGFNCFNAEEISSTLSNERILSGQSQQKIWRDCVVSCLAGSGIASAIQDRISRMP